MGSQRGAALQPDRAGAGRGSTGHSTELLKSPSACHRSHTQHSLPRAWGTSRLAHGSPMAQGNCPIHLLPLAEGLQCGALMLAPR